MTVGTLDPTTGMKLSQGLMHQKGMIELSETETAIKALQQQIIDVTEECDHVQGAELKARLHPKWVGGREGYLYSVIFGGKLLIENSRCPECDVARALVAKGIAGKLTLSDGKTGKPRTVINIEKAAKLTVKEGPNGPRLLRQQTCANSPYSPETELEVRGGLTAEEYRWKLMREFGD